MAGNFTINETINTLKAIFEKHKNERVCVLGTMCCGKTTLLQYFPDCVDIDDVAFRDITNTERAFISQTPWTKEIGDAVDRIVYEKVQIQQGRPMFGTVILDCEVVIYLDISNELLAEHCQKRGVDLTDSLNMKEAIEQDWNEHREKMEKIFYYVMMLE